MMINAGKTSKLLAINKYWQKTWSLWRHHSFVVFTVWLVVGLAADYLMMKLRINCGE
jgi:hypothetical protein